MLKILVAEDDKNIRTVIAKTLQNAGFEVVECVDGEAALASFEKQHVDLVVTDIMMPRLDGDGLVIQLRKIVPDIPIIMLTALERIEDKEKSFNNGADDYIVKPVSMKELVLRVKALLKRAKLNSESVVDTGNNIKINFKEQKITVDGEMVELSKKLFLLFFKLATNPNIIFTREQLMNEIWGYDSESDDRTIDTHIRWLREKIPQSKCEIVTVRGIGYKAIIK